MDCLMLQSEACEVYKIRGDGNCMFAAAAHQLFGYEIGSVMHTATTQAIREMVVEYIRKNAKDDELQMMIAMRVSEECSWMEGTSMEETVLNYSYVLAQDREWGADESLFAISRMFHANITVYRERGHTTIVEEEDVPPERAIHIVYRGEQGNWDHYDSFYRFDKLHDLNLPEQLQTPQPVMDHLDGSA